MIGQGTINSAQSESKVSVQYYFKLAKRAEDSKIDLLLGILLTKTSISPHLRLLYYSLSSTKLCFACLTNFRVSLFNRPWEIAIQGMSCFSPFPKVSYFDYYWTLLNVIESTFDDLVRHQNLLSIQHYWAISKNNKQLWTISGNIKHYWIL